MNRRYLLTVFIFMVLLSAVYTGWSVMTPERGADHIYVGEDFADFLGEQIAVADINNDDFDDVITGAFWSKETLDPKFQCTACAYNGAIQVFFGNNPIGPQQVLDLKYPPAGHDLPDLAILGIEAGDRLIHVGSGHVNDDGFSDLILGATEYHVLEDTSATPVLHSVQTDEGEVYVILGAQTMPDTIDLADPDTFATYVEYYIMGVDTSDRFGYVIASADINDDDYDEIIVGAPWGDGLDDADLDDNYGEVYVFFPNPSYGMPDTVDLASDDVSGYAAVIYGSAPGDVLGSTRIPVGSFSYNPPAIATGNWNGDLYQDIVIGAGNAKNVNNGGAPANQGAAYIIFGDRLAPGDTVLLSVAAGQADGPDVAVFGKAGSDYLGTGVAFANIDGDAYHDLILGAPRADNDTMSTSGKAGEAYVIFGATTQTLASDPTRDLSENSGFDFTGVDIVIFGQDEGDDFGSYMSAGDVDNDQCDDVGITARRAEPTAELDEAGETSIFFGRSRDEWNNTPFIRLQTDREASRIIKLAAVEDAEMATVRFGQVDGVLGDEVVFGAYDAGGTDPEDNLAGQMYVMKGSDVWKSGQITTSQTWESNVFVSGDIEVAAGDTLTIAPGTDVFIWPNDLEKNAIGCDTTTWLGCDTTRVEFIVKGYLDVQGTTTAPVRFLAWSDSLESTRDDTWRGIRMVSTSEGANFSVVTVKNAITGVVTYADATIEYCTFEYCNIGLEIHGDSAYVDYTTFENMGFESINLLQDGKLSLNNSSLEDGAYGVAVYSGAKLWAYNTSIENTGIGVYIYEGEDTVYVDPQASLAFCDIKSNSIGVSVTEVSDVELTSCLIDNNPIGVTLLLGADIEMRANNIKNAITAVNCYNSSPEIRKGNKIKSSLIGINCDNYSDAVVESTTVSGNGKGIVIKNGSSPELGRALAAPASKGYNVITNDTTYAIENLTGAGIKAERNWWGSESGPDTSNIYGSVDYIPWLHTKPEVEPEPYEDPGESSPYMPDELLPRAFRMSNGYPNPFNPTTRLDYEVPRPGGKVTITVFNVMGQRVATLVNDHKPPGYYGLTWNGRSDRGGTVATGVYFVSMRAPGFAQTRKLVLLK